MNPRIPAIILGGTGYVAGELLRLTLAHPRLELAAIASDSQPGEPVGKAFPHLAAACGDLLLRSHLGSGRARGAPRAKRGSRSRTARRLPHADRRPARPAQKPPARSPRSSTSRPITASPTSAEYERIYKHAHGAPGRAKDFTCAVPEHLAAPRRRTSRTRAAS